MTNVKTVIKAKKIRQKQGQNLISPKTQEFKNQMTKLRKAKKFNVK